MSQRLTSSLLIVLLLLALLVPATVVQAKDEPRHAPNLYIDWPDHGTYDIITVDWYCEKEAPGTYWAVHSWDVTSTYTGQDDGGGYAGFQTLENGDHVILMSLWNLDDGTAPSIVYASGGYSGHFDHEGSGGQIFTDYDWKPETWYTMRIQAWDHEGESYFAQWVKEKGGDWQLTAVLSYPVTGLRFSHSSVFQEDFVMNNELRRCRVRNAYGRFVGTKTWDSWSTATVSSSYFPVEPEAHDDWSDVQLNINFSCDTWAKKRSVWLETGGGDFTPSGHYLPAVFTVTQKATPKNTKWLSFTKALKKIEIERSANINVSWPEADKKYDILSLDFYCRHDAPSTRYYTHLWNFGSHRFETDENGEHAVVLEFQPCQARRPQNYWINERYASDLDWNHGTLKIKIDYPWEIREWYTVRLQLWDIDGVTYVGHWIATAKGSFELMAVTSYDTRRLEFKDLVASLYATSDNTDTREMRVRNAYGRAAGKDKWEHWEKYEVTNYLLDDENQPIWNIKNNVETKRKGGCVRLKTDGDKMTLYKRDYPFTFRIHDEDDKPNPAKFIEKDLPEEIRP